MIFTAYTAAADPATQWRADLLEYSWRRLRQPGALIRLAPMRPGRHAPAHVAARVVETLPWNPHPYTEDGYAGYELPAAALEWLFRERVDGTVLLLGPHSILQHTITEEATPGRVVAAPWPDMPTGDGPLGLPEEFKFLECYCVNRQLPLASVQPPLLIHTSDLRKIAARWLELTSIIRAEGKGPHGKLRDADRVAYVIAAAENRLLHGLAEIATGTEGESSKAPILDYTRSVESPRGDIVWNQDVYHPWDTVYPEKARPGAGRDFLALLNELVTRRTSGADLGVVRPQRRPGVREARLLEDVQLEIPGCVELVTLNDSAAAIWELCDGKRTLAEIVGELQQRFDAPRETLAAAVESTAKELDSAGALELEDLL